MLTPPAPPEGRRSEKPEEDRSEKDERGTGCDKIEPLDEDHRVASLCFMRRIIILECRFQNIEFVTRCTRGQPNLQFDYSFTKFYQYVNHDVLAANFIHRGWDYRSSQSPPPCFRHIRIALVGRARGVNLASFR